MAITKVTSSVLSSGSATDGYVLTADGSGNSAWEAAAGGGVAGIVSTADATAITIDSNENVGIGTSNLLAPGGADATTLTLEANLYAQWISRVSGGLSNETTWRNIVRTGGIYQIQTTNDAMTSEQTAYEINRVTQSNSINYHRWFSGTSERMRLDNNVQAGGALRIGTTGVLSSSPEKVSVLGSVGVSVKTTSYAEYAPLILWNNASTANNSSTLSLITFKSLSNGVIGSITSVGTTTSYNTSSDYRLKENVDYTWDATTRLKQLKPARFNFISDADKTVDGFLAHEVQDIVPEAITGQKDAMKEEEYEVTPEVLDDDGNVVTEAVWGTRTVPDYQGIDQAKLVPLLTKALQEQQTIIEDLQARIETLENA